MMGANPSTHALHLNSETDDIRRHSDTAANIHVNVTRRFRGAYSSVRRTLSNLNENGENSRRLNTGHRRLQTRRDDLHIEAEAQEISGNWEVVRTHGPTPCERSGHGVVVRNNKAFMFGGYGGTSPSHLSDFFSYDFGKKIWEHIASPGGPCPRTAFALCASPDSYIYIWGGTDHNLQGLADQALYQFDIYHYTWKQIETLNKGILHLRYFGRSASYYKNKIYYFGGGVKGGRFTNELIELDLIQLKWNRIATHGDIPCPRYKHQACIVGDVLYVIGGGCYLPPEETVDVYALDLKTWVWNKVQTIGQEPEGRAAHACEYDPVTHAIYMWGGFNQSLVPLFDFYKLDLTTLQWSHKAVASIEDLTWPGRSFHASCIHGGALYSFNGSDGETRYADLMKFQIHNNPFRLTDLSLLALHHAGRNHQKNAALLPELKKQLEKLKGAKRTKDGHTVPYS